MAEITFKGKPIHTSGSLPAKGSVAPDAAFVKMDLSVVKLSSYSGKKVLNVFPSVDTGVCATSVRTFTKKAAERPGVVVLHVSADLPFAHKRFCGAEGIANAESLSTFRSTFAKDYGLTMTEGPLEGLCARAVLVLDGDNKVVYAELVPEIAQEPNYDAALAAV